MAGDEVNVLFHAGATGLVAATVLGGYDPGNLIKSNRAIRHMPFVVDTSRRQSQRVLSR